LKTFVWISSKNSTSGGCVLCVVCVHIQPFRIFAKQQVFLYYIYVNIQYSTLLHLPPLIFHCVGGCWDRFQDCCDFSICSHPHSAILSTLGKISSKLLKLSLPCYLLDKKLKVGYSINHPDCNQLKTSRTSCVLNSLYMLWLNRRLPVCIFSVKMPR
jgi:hypothetical protein